MLDTLQAAAHASTAPDFLSATGQIALLGNDSDTAGAVASSVLAARGLVPPPGLVTRLHCNHGWQAWQGPGSAADLEAFVPE